MKAVTDLEANHAFADLLSEVEGGEEVTILKQGRAVAVLSPYRRLEGVADRKVAIDRAIAAMEEGLPWPEGAVRRFTRDEMHER